MDFHSLLNLPAYEIKAWINQLRIHLQDDESLRRWKEKLLGSVEGNLTGLRMLSLALLFFLSISIEYRLIFELTCFFLRLGILY